MSVVINMRAQTFEIRCDDCQAVTVTPVGVIVPIGWTRDEEPGGPHHYCPTCTLDFTTDWDAA